ncbi:MAG: alginate export family protein [Acidobacteriota bacterium]|nr:MAG: alginate export family protein [Acidobacteriota bacterium]
MKTQIIRYVFISIIIILTSFPVFAQGTQASTSAVPASTPKPAAQDSIRIGGVTLSGSIRFRAEGWDWFETSAANNDYWFGAALLRVGLSQQTERIDWQVEGAAPVFFGLPDDAIAPGAQGQLGLGATYYAANRNQDAGIFIKQAFVRFKGLGGDKPSTLRIGRFEFNDGTELAPSDPSLATIKRDHISQRLIGTFGFTHVGRSFDGIHFSRTAGGANITFVGARPTEGVFQLRGWKQLDVDFYYGAFTKSLKRKSSEGDLRIFAIHYHDGRRAVKTDNRPLAARVADTDNIRLNTLGGHYITTFDAGAGKADLLIWGAGQFGSWGALDHSAGAVALEAGYQFKAPAQPWIRGGYFRSSGDGDPADDRHGAFFQMLPTPRLYARMPFYDLINNEDAFVQLRLKPHSRIGLRTDLHHIRLSSDKDLWYLGGGAFQGGTFGYVGRPSNGERTLGTLVDFSFDLNINPKTAFTFYIAGVRGGGVIEKIYPEGRAGKFAYFEVTRRF